jgi:hypothetical protein
MPITIICPICSQQATVGDHLAGGVTSCPSCANAVRIPEAGQIQLPPAPPPVPREYPPERERRREWDRDAEPRRRPRYDEPRERNYPPERDYAYDEERLHPSWRTVRNGLTLVRLSIVIVIFAILGILVVALVIAGMLQPGVGRPNAAEAAGSILVLVGGFTGLACIALMFVGEGMCCAAPAESRAGGLALGAIICHALVILVYLGLVILLVSIGRRIDLFREFSILVLGGALLVVGLSFAWQILFIVFLRAVARAFDNERLAQSVNAFLTYHCVVTGGSFFLFVLIGVMESGPIRANRGGLEGLAGLCAIVLFVGAIADLVWFLSVLVRTRDNIGPRYRRSRRYDY